MNHSVEGILVIVLLSNQGNDLYKLNVQGSSQKHFCDEISARVGHLYKPVARYESTLDISKISAW